MPGYVNYKYKNGSLPGHTKLAFSEYKILTVQNLVALNAFLLIYKIKKVPFLIPLSIRLTISDDSPTLESTYEGCENWLRTYNNHIYNKSVFFKGPLIFAKSMINENISPESFLTLKSYKKNVKQALLLKQKSGVADEWQSDNFILHNIPGLRISRTRRDPVIYTEFFE